MRFIKWLAAIALSVAFALGLFQLMSRKTYPLELGVSFNQVHAAALGLDWKKVYVAALDDLKPKYVRVAAMWNQVEPEPGQWDFSQVDFLLDEAARRGAKVMLVVGQKAPRWPECHVPAWVKYDSGQSLPPLLSYIRKAVERYRDHPALEIWQVENEPYIQFRFGECRDYHSEFLAAEIALVKSLDSAHPTLVTDSGELGLWYKAIKAGDLFGTTMYRIVRTPSGKIATYGWLPPAFYRVKTRLFGRPLSEVYISELQAEPWFTGNNPLTAPLAEQELTMNPERLRRHIDYARRTGLPRAYLWGAEWWYFMKEKNGDSRYWEIVRDEIDGAYSP